MMRSLPSSGGTAERGDVFVVSSPACEEGSDRARRRPARRPQPKKSPAPSQKRLRLMEVAILSLGIRKLRSGVRGKAVCLLLVQCFVLSTQFAVPSTEYWTRRTGHGVRSPEYPVPIT